MKNTHLLPLLVLVVSVFTFDAAAQSASVFAEAQTVFTEDSLSSVGVGAFAGNHNSGACLSLNVGENMTSFGVTYLIQVVTPPRKPKSWLGVGFRFVSNTPLVRNTLTPDEHLQRIPFKRLCYEIRTFREVSDNVIIGLNGGWHGNSSTYYGGVSLGILFD